MKSNLIPVLSAAIAAVALILVGFFAGVQTGDNAPEMFCMEVTQ